MIWEPQRSHDSRDLVLGVWNTAICYIITSAMTSHDHHGHHHHHHPGHIHPPTGVAPSILRLSVVQRLAVSAGLIALLWIVTFWAVQ